MVAQDISHAIFTMEVAAEDIKFEISDALPGSDAANSSTRTSIEIAF